MKFFLSELAPFTGQERVLDVHYEAAELNGWKVIDSEILSFTVMMEKDGRIRVGAEGNVVLDASCDRCLSPVKIRVPFSENVLLDPAGSKDEDGDPVFCFTENALDTDEFLSELIRPNLPMQVLCKEDCKGLCPVCGIDLNRSSCKCAGQSGSIRMAEALKKAFSGIETEIKID